MEDRISDMFDISREASRVAVILIYVMKISAQLLEVYCEETPVIVDADLCMYSVNASFASASGRGKPL
jgi:hypothetical protein